MPDRIAARPQPTLVCLVIGMASVVAASRLGLPGWGGVATLLLGVLAGLVGSGRLAGSAWPGFVAVNAGAVGLFAFFGLVLGQAGVQWLLALTIVILLSNGYGIGWLTRRWRERPPDVSPAQDRPLLVVSALTIVVLPVVYVLVAIWFSAAPP
jgi:hypothetical protein